MALFTALQLDTLRRDYALIQSVDPCLPTYGKITAKLDAMTDDQIVQIAGADIKWLSSLARNRVMRRGLTL